MESKEVLDFVPAGKFFCQLYNLIYLDECCHAHIYKSCCLCKQSFTCCAETWVDQIVDEVFTFSLWNQKKKHLKLAEIFDYSLAGTLFI